MNIIRRHALPDPSPLHVRPPVARILANQHESLSFGHAMLCIAPRFVIIQRLHILQFLGASFRRYGWTLFLADTTSAGRPDGGGRAVGRDWSVGREACGGELLEVGGGDEAGRIG